MGVRVKKKMEDCSEEIPGTDRRSERWEKKKKYKGGKKTKKNNIWITRAEKKNLKRGWGRKV